MRAIARAPPTSAAKRRRRASSLPLTTFVYITEDIYRPEFAYSMLSALRSASLRKRMHSLNSYHRKNVVGQGKPRSKRSELDLCRSGSIAVAVVGQRSGRIIVDNEVVRVGCCANGKVVYRQRAWRGERREYCIIEEDRVVCDAEVCNLIHVSRGV